MLNSKIMAVLHPDSGHLTLDLPESGPKCTFSERLASFLNSALKVTHSDAMFH